MRDATPRIEESLEKRSVVAMVVKRPMNNLVVVMLTSTKRGAIVVTRGILMKRRVNVVVTKKRDATARIGENLKMTNLPSMLVKGRLTSLVVVMWTSINVGTIVDRIVVDDTDMEATRVGFFEEIEAAESSCKNKENKQMGEK